MYYKHKESLSNIASKGTVVFIKDIVVDFKKETPVINVLIEKCLSKTDLSRDYTTINDKISILS